MESFNAAFVTLATPILNQVWWTCKLRTDCKNPNQLVMEGDGLAIMKFSVDERGVHFTYASDHWFPEFADATELVPMQFSLGYVFDVFTRFAGYHCQAAMQARHREELARRGIKV